MDLERFREAGFTPVRITMEFDPGMQLVVGEATIEAIVDEGCPFGFVLQNLLIDYPEIWNRYPPGILGFTLNGVAPPFDAPLAEGDRLQFFVAEMPATIFARCMPLRERERCH
jgi:hypothetical protein